VRFVFVVLVGVVVIVHTARVLLGVLRVRVLLMIIVVVRIP